MLARTVRNKLKANWNCRNLIFFKTSKNSMKCKFIFMMKRAMRAFKME
jgi:hypothetical protein